MAVECNSFWCLFNEFLQCTQAVTEKANGIDDVHGQRSENEIDIANAMYMKTGYASMALFHRIRSPFNACVLLMAFLCIMFMEFSCSVNLFLSFIESTDTFDTYQTVVITQQCL